MEHNIDELEKWKRATTTASWLAMGDGMAKCSRCGFIFDDVYDNDSYDDYCRRCGAAMDGIYPYGMHEA